MSDTKPSTPSEEIERTRDIDALRALARWFANPDAHDEDDEPGVWVGYDDAIDLAGVVARAAKVMEATA